MQEEMKLQREEMYTASRVKQEFDSLMECIRANWQRNSELCKNVTSKLEAMLLSHKIRGKTILDQISDQFACGMGGGDENTYKCRGLFGCTFEGVCGRGKL